MGFFILINLISKFYKYIIISVFLLITFSSVFSQDKVIIKSYEIDDINIIFKTKSIFEESDIKLLLATREGDIFDFDAYLQDVERIKKYFFDNGFFDVSVDTGLIYKDDDSEIDENFIVTENIRYRYYDIQYKGIDDIDENVKAKINNLNDKKLIRGRYYSKDTVKLEVNRVLNILYDNGYAIAKSENPEVLKYETTDDNLKDKVNITLTFITDKKFNFGTTTVTFPAKRYNVTKNDIMRELTFKDGQLYNKSEVVNSELNLSKISLIENPRIAIENIDSANSKIDFSIKAMINSKYSLSPEVFGYYYQQVFYMGTGLKFTDKNFFGGGRVLTSGLSFYFHSLNDNRFEFLNSIYQPFLFNNRKISGIWDIGAEFRIIDDVSLYQFKNSFGISYDLPVYTYINKLNLKWEIINNRLLLGDIFIAGGFTYNYFTSTLDLTAIHNSSNDIKFPFKGNYQSYDIEEGGLLSGIVRRVFNTNTVSYVRFSNFNSLYFNLTNQQVNVSAVLAGKFLSGVIFEYGDNSFTIEGVPVSFDRVPTDKKFVSGGSSSVRGWAAKQLGIVVNKNAGGNFVVESSIEHRLRPFLNAENLYIRDLGYATFIDVGNVWQEIDKFKFNELALAMGGGIRYYTIIGAIRLDLGFKIYDPQPGPVGGSNWIFGEGCNYSDKYNIQFGIGNTF